MGRRAGVEPDTPGIAATSLGEHSRSQLARMFLSANEHTMADAAMDVRLWTKTTMTVELFPPAQAVAVPGCAESAAGAPTPRAVASWERIVASNT